MKRYRKDLSEFLSHRWIVGCLLAVAVLAYGYAAVNTSISIDDLEGDRYVGSGNIMLSTGRFGMWLWSVVQGGWTNSYLIDFMAIGFFLLAALNYGILFRRISHGKISLAACTVFGCMLISYPLMNEIWEYTGANLNVTGGFWLVSVALLLVHEQIHEGCWRTALRLIPAALSMMVVCAAYESVAAVYVFMVFAVLYLQIIYGSQKEKKFWEIIRQGVIYAGILLAGVVLRVVVHKMILGALDLQQQANGATELAWGTAPFATIMKNLFSNWIHDYVIRGIVYLPLTVLVVAEIVFLGLMVAGCKKHGAIVLLPSLGMLLSLVLLSILQGTVSPYRTCQVFAIFVAFVTMRIVIAAESGDRKWHQICRKVVLAGCAVLCFYQAAYMNHFLVQNHIRSEEEAYVIREIGTELKRNFDTSKPVTFVGGYELSSHTVEAVSIPADSAQWQLYQKALHRAQEILKWEELANPPTRKLPQTNVNSVLQWGEYAFKQEGMQNLFAYYGFDYVLADYNSAYYEGITYVWQNSVPIYPRPGYIQDAGAYIVVRLGQ